MALPLSTESLSFVIPMRNCEDEVTDRLIDTVEKLLDLGIDDAEFVIVDDGSTDGTSQQLSQLSQEHANIRIMRHDRPRGMEASGQTGLERATGQVVLIQEDQRPLRLEDLRQLLRMSVDPSVVAARTESRDTPPSPSLIRRLRAWGTNADRQIERFNDPSPFSSIQMIRRPHLNRLAGPKGRYTKLKSEKIDSLS